MTPRLRQRHRLIWVLLALLLPALFVLALLNLPPELPASQPLQLP
jgi:RsiW-degrading membrane proteinase PrsW (M82 family)